MVIAGALLPTAGRSARFLVRAAAAAETAEEQARLVNLYLPLLWAPNSYRRYAAHCAMTTRVYLPFALHVLEWMSFPLLFGRALGSEGEGTMPATAAACRAAVVDALATLLTEWTARCDAAGRENSDLAADVCEACGRLGLHETTDALMMVVLRVAWWDGEPRTAALQALGAMPPAQIPHFWKALREAPGPTRIALAGAITSMESPAAASFLDSLLTDDEGAPATDFVALAAIRGVGLLGGPHCLPALRDIARDDENPLQREAITAMRQIAGRASGQDELTLLRGSDSATEDAASLVRAPAAEEPARDLLHPAVHAPADSMPVRLSRARHDA